MKFMDLIRGKKVDKSLPDTIQVLINKPVISVPDEWSDIIIGICTDYKDGLFVIRDFISGEELEVNYKTYVFTEQRFQCVLKVDRFDLCSLIYPEQCVEEEFKRDKNIYLLKPHEVNTKLRTNGFWEVLLEYKQSKIQAS